MDRRTGLFALLVGIGLLTVGGITTVLPMRAWNSDFTWSPKHPKVGDWVTFEAVNKTQDVSLYNFYVDDMLCTTGKYSFKYIFREPGDHPVSLALITPEEALSSTFKTITIIPTEVTYDLTISVDPPGGGTTTPSPGTHTYTEWAGVTLKAVASAGYEFWKWTNYYTTHLHNVCVTMVEDISMTAHFRKKDTDPDQPGPQPPTYRLTTSVKPRGAGTVSPSSGTFDEGKKVTITATPYSGYEFNHWGGNASGTGSPVTIVMDSNKHVVANFAEVEPPSKEYELTTSVARGKGSISPESGTFASGEKVTVQAIPDSGYVFERWGGDLSGQQNPTTVVMNRDHHVEAYFKARLPKEVTITLKVTPPGSGTITLAQSRQISVERETIVNLQAYPNLGYEFDYWGGDVSGKNQLLRFMALEDTTVIAKFSKVKRIGDIISENLNLILMGLGISLVIGGVVTLRR